MYTPFLQPNFLQDAVPCSAITYVRQLSVSYILHYSGEGLESVMQFTWNSSSTFPQTFHILKDLGRYVSSEWNA